MSGWIKWEKDLETDPRVLRMVATLRRTAQEGNERYAPVTQERDRGVPWLTLVCGGLLRLWAYADSHIRSDNSIDLGPDEIDELVGISGFARAMPDDWLCIVDEACVELPNFQEHNSVKAKKTALTQKRMQRYRQRESVTPVTQKRNESVTKASPDQTRPDQDQNTNTTAASRPADDPHAEQFQQFKNCYPKRAGSQPWPRARKAINARLKEGHTWEEILAGAERYAAFCEATGKVGTETVMQAATFCGPDKRFLEPFDLPTANRGRLGMAKPAPKDAFEQSEEEVEKQQRIMERW